MPLSDKDVEDRIIDEANNLENYTIADIDELEREWFSSSLQEFVDGLPAKEKWLLRRRAWEMLCCSVEKSLIAETVVEDIYEELGQNPEDQTVYDSFCIAILGSVARFEAEQHSDIDLDIVIDNATDTNRDWIYEDCIRRGSKHIGMIKAQQAHDMRIIGFDDLDDEYNTNDDYNHLIKLFQAGSWLERPNDASRDSDLDTWLDPNNLDLQDLVDERYDWAADEYSKIKNRLADKENYPTSSKFHHVGSWLCQIISVTVGLEEESQLPYWKIVDEMEDEVPAELSQGDWNEIRDACKKVMQLRPHVFPSIDKAEAAKRELSRLENKAINQKNAFSP